MSDAQQDARYLELFPAWLRTLGDDANTLAAVLASDAPEPARRFAAAGLTYIFKSLDLIPDGIDDLGYCDDAFVLRVCARLGQSASGGPVEGLEALADGAADVEAFLGVDYPRIVAYAERLPRGSARGRSVDDVMGDVAVRDGFVAEIRSWAAAYAVPSFTRDPKTLVKLRAFLSAKLA